MQINKYFAVGEEFLWCWCKNFCLCLDYYYDGLTRWAKKAFDVWWNWETEKSVQPEIDQDRDREKTANTQEYACFERRKEAVARYKPKKRKAPIREVLN